MRPRFGAFSSVLKVGAMLGLGATLGRLGLGAVSAELPVRQRFSAFSSELQLWPLLPDPGRRLGTGEELRVFQAAAAVSGVLPVPGRRFGSAALTVPGRRFGAGEELRVFKAAAANPPTRSRKRTRRGAALGVAASAPARPAAVCFSTGWTLDVALDFGTGLSILPWQACCAGGDSGSQGPRKL